MVSELNHLNLNEVIQKNQILEMAENVSLNQYSNYKVFQGLFQVNKQTRLNFLLQGFIYFQCKFQREMGIVVLQN